MKLLLKSFLLFFVLIQAAQAGRMYDPEIGRFIQRDPTGYVDGMSLYNGYFSEKFGLDPSGLKIIVESDGRSNGFVQDIQAALIEIIGDCADLTLNNIKSKKKKLRDGRTVNIITYAELSFTNEKPECKCNKCWKELKEALNSSNTFTIKNTGNRKNPAHADQDENGDGKVFMVPNGEVRFFGEVLSNGGIGTQETPYSVVLWHELIAHAVHGEGHPEEVDGKSNSRFGGGVDPSIPFENMAKECFNLNFPKAKLKPRVPYYYPSFWSNGFLGNSSFQNGRNTENPYHDHPYPVIGDGTAPSAGELFPLGGP